MAFSYTVLLVLGTMLIAVLFLSKPMFIQIQYNTSSEELLNYAEEELVLTSATSASLRVIGEELYENERENICSITGDNYEQYSYDLNDDYGERFAIEMQDYLDKIKPVMSSLRKEFGNSIGIRFDPEKIQLSIAKLIIYTFSKEVAGIRISYITFKALMVDMKFGRDEKLWAVNLGPEVELALGSMAVGDVIVNFTLNPDEGLKGVGVESIKVYRIEEVDGGFNKEIVSVKARALGPSVVVEIPVDLLPLLNGDTLRYLVIVEYYNGLPVYSLICLTMAEKKA